MAGPEKHLARYEQTRVNIGFPYLKEKYISEILEVIGHFQRNLLRLRCHSVQCKSFGMWRRGVGESENRKENRGRGGNLGFTFAFSSLTLPKIFLFSTSPVTLFVYIIYTIEAIKHDLDFFEYFIS